MAAGLDRKYRKLRRLIAVQFVYAGFESWQAIGGGFKQEQGFLRCLDLSLPAVDGFDGGDERGAGDKPLLDECAAQARGFFGAGNGGHRDAGRRCGFEHEASLK